ncbi:MAG TPA: hypothetical protein VF131_26525 [Blastocatellia bacterium]|nr:hypothetical protein [Blastocatellia bacterium]
MSLLLLLHTPPTVAQETDRAGLVAAARRAGDYLVRMQLEDGSFHYSYDPVEDRTSRRVYNIVRHAGAVSSLFELYGATREARYLDAARRGVLYLKTRFRPAREKGAVYVIDNDGKAKLGAVGLALLALARQIELDPGSADRESANKLAKMILVMQRADGSFISYYPVRGDEPRGSVSHYYPGEAILGLMRLFKTSGDPRLLGAARRGADYLIESQRKMNPPPSDAWLMQALEALHNAGREQKNSSQKHADQKNDDQKYVDHVLRLAERMIADQYTANDPARYAGGFGPGPPRVTPAAARAEGLLAAYRTARSIDDGRAARIAAALRAATRFQLSQQFTADSDNGLRNPERASGGFRESLTSMRVRIDYVQHNISSLLGVAYTLY